MAAPAPAKLPPGDPPRRGSVWRVVLGSLAVALLALLTINALVDRAETAESARLRLLQIGQAAAAAEALDLALASVTAVDPALVDRLRDTDAAFAATVAAFGQEVGADDATAEAIAAMERFIAEEAEEHRLLATGQLNEAVAAADADDRQRLDAALGPAGDLLAQRARQARRAAAIGGVATVLATVAAAGFLGWRAERARHDAATAATERRALRRSEARYRALVENASDLVAVVGPDGTIRYVGPTIERVLARAPVRVAGRNVFDFIHPDDAPLSRTALAGTAARPGPAPPLEVRLRHGDGSWRRFEVIANNRLGDPDLAGIVFNARDVEERAAAEAAHRASEERYRDLVDRGEGLICSHDLDGRFLSVNPAAARVLGYAQAEMVGRNLRDFAPPAFRPLVDRYLARIAREPVVSSRLRVLTRTGEERTWAYTNARYEEPGRPPYVVGHAHDVTERTRLERRLRDNERELRGLFAATQRQAQELALLGEVRTAVARELDPAAVFHRVVEAIASTFGYAMVSLYLIEGGHLRLQHQVGYHRVLDGIPLDRGVMGRVARTGQPALVEDAAASPEAIWAFAGIVSEVCVPLRDEGRPVGVLNVESTGGVTLGPADLSLMVALAEHVDSALARARLFAAARESERRYRGVVDGVTEVIFQIDGAGRWSFLNPAWAELTGLPVAAGLGRPAFASIHPDDRPRSLRRVLRLARRGLTDYHDDLRYLARDGEVGWLELRARLLFAADGAILGAAGTATDVTARKRAEQARAGQNKVLGMVAAGDRLETVMDALCRHVEGLVPGARCAVSLGEPSGRPLPPVSAPRLPLPLVAALRDARIAAPTRPGQIEVIAPTVEPSWPAPARAAATEAGLLGCWLATVDEGDTPTGSLLAVFLPGARPPALHERDLIVEAGNLAGIAVRSQRAAEVSRESHFRALVQNASDLVSILEPDGRVRYESPAIERILGYRQDELIGTDATALVHPDDIDALTAAFADLAPGASVPAISLRTRHKDGSWVTMEAVAVNLTEHPSVGGFVVTSRDVTERVRTEDALRGAERRYRDLFDGAPIMYVITRDAPDGPIIADCNLLFLSTLGYPREEVIGRPFVDFYTPASAARMRGGAYRRALRGEFVEEERQFVTRDGRTLDVLIRAQPEPDVAGVVVNVRTMFVDVTARKAMERALAHQAFHDALTGLPNRARFLDRLDQALAPPPPSAAEPAALAAVLFLDLDDFKIVNDSLGHRAGDELLVTVAHRLPTCTPAGSLVARFGGDEFAVLVERVVNRGAADRLAERIIAGLQTPVAIGPHEVVVTPTIGIAVGAPGTVGGEELLRKADVALYEAKRRGKASFAAFDPSMDARAGERLRLEQDLRRAIAGGQLRLHYQPIIDLATGELATLEALVRWEHPERGAIAPGTFIPLAEDGGLIIPLGGWVLTEACRQLAAWAEQGLDDIPVAVNLSVRQLAQPDLVPTGARALRAAGVAPRRLRLEVTESAAISDPETSLEKLRALRTLGVRLAIDDFGTGYSGLSALKQWPVDTLKIDRSFVDGLGHDADDSAIVRAVLALSSTLGLTATAEGIETAAQLAELRQLGCHHGQGYLLARPVPAAAIPALYHDAPWRNLVLPSAAPPRPAPDRPRALAG